MNVGVRHCQSLTLTSFITVNPAIASKARSTGTYLQRLPTTMASSPS